jgi:hypothetical protein
MLHKAEERKVIRHAPKIKLMKGRGRCLRLDDEAERKVLAGTATCKWPEDLVLYCARHDYGTRVLMRTGNLAAVHHADRPLVTGSLISSVLIMFSTTCRIIVLACVLERAADWPMRSSARTIHLFDSGRLGQSQGLDADTAWQL